MLVNEAHDLHRVPFGFGNEICLICAPVSTHSAKVTFTKLKEGKIFCNITVVSNGSGSGNAFLKATVYGKVIAFKVFGDVRSPYFAIGFK